MGEWDVFAFTKHTCNRFCSLTVFFFFFFFFFFGGGGGGGGGVERGLLKHDHISL